MAQITRVGEMRNGGTVLEEEMGEDGVILGNKVTKLVEAGEEIRGRKGQMGGKKWEGMLEEVDGDQYRKSGQVEIGESNSPNQIMEEEEDGRMRGKMEETQVGIQVWVVGGTGIVIVLHGEHGEQVAQEVEGVEEVG